MTHRLAVVGAGPAGRALAHRAARRGVDVALIDPDPHRPWSATYGMFVDDLPTWIDPSAIAVARTETVVYTSHRQVLPRGYVVLDPAVFQRSLDLAGVTLVSAPATHVSDMDVVTANGRRITADVVIDARGTARTGVPAPRQTAVGTFLPGASGETVLMDWSRASGDDPTFSYRVDTGRGRLVEETCLAGSPATSFQELQRRNAIRLDDEHGAGERDIDEWVDFPMHVGPRPWNRGPGAPLRFGAAGGLMNPATGYSVAPSLAAVDVIVDAVVSGRDPARALWPLRAKAVYSLRFIGLSVLLALDGPALQRFFAAFFDLGVARQRSYLSGRDDLVGILATMLALFARVPWRIRGVMVRQTVSTAAHRR